MGSCEIQRGEGCAASPAEAIAAVGRHCAPVGMEEVPLAAACGRVLAQDVVADRASPAADVSAMDGFAVRSSEAARGELPLMGEARAGRAPGELATGHAMAISTGAVIPAGADAVVKKEEATVRDGRLACRGGVAPGQNIRRAGENGGAGAKVGEAGVVVSPALAGAMASFGLRRVRVHRRVRVGVVVTGDELTAGAGALPAWQLRDSNGPALAAMMGSAAWVESKRCPRSADDPDATRRAIDEAGRDVDLLLVTGGVSMGDHDHVPGALGALGANVVFHRVTQRPGRPVLGAVLASGVPVLGLPGNPVSVMVTARQMARPVAARLAGVRGDEPVTAVRVEGHDKTLDLWWHRLVRLMPGGVARVADGRGSGDVVAAATADAFVEIPPGLAGAGPWALFKWEW